MEGQKGLIVWIRNKMVYFKGGMSLKQAWMIVLIAIAILIILISAVDQSLRDLLLRAILNALVGIVLSGFQVI